MEQLLTGREAFAKTIGGWQITLNGMLYRKELNEGLIRGKYMNSDEFSSRQILFYAKSVAFSDARYIYRQYNGSISRQAAPRLWQRAFVDLQIVDFVKTHYSTDKTVCRDAVSAQFFNLVHLTADARLKNMRSDDRKRVIKEMKEAYEMTDKNMVGEFLPAHRKVFMHGCNWFAVISVLYEYVRKLSGKKTYQYK
jgi:hypothetical protein